MPAFKDVDDLFAHVVTLYLQENYAGALDLATQGLALFPANKNFVESVRAMLAARLNDSDLALRLLGQLMEENGYWFGENFWQDSDFDAIRANPEFGRLRAISEDRAQAARVAIKPELTVFEPDTARKPSPLLIALHGNASSVFWHKAHWQPAVKSGWLVALPQSSQVVGYDSHDQYAYSWNDEQIVDQEIGEHYAALKNQQSLVEDRIVVAGFSRGAGHAVRLALHGVIPARGFIAVCPGGPTSRDPELWNPIIETATRRDLRGYVIVGGQDHESYQSGLALGEKLRGAGFAVETAVYEEMAHDYPPDFKDRLPEMLAFIFG